MPGVFSKLCCARRQLHPDLQARVLPITLRRYARIFDLFSEFAQTLEVDPGLSELEAIETAIQSFRDAENLSKTLHQRVVTAVEFFMPQLKGSLKSSREAVKGHLQREPTLHTVASTSRIVFLFSCTLSSLGKARVGIGLILQCQSGLRADELFDIRKCDVAIPLDTNEVMIIAIGVRKKTKAKRTQHIVLEPIRHRESYLLIQVLVQATTEGELLFPFNYWFFHSAIQAMDLKFDLNLGLSGHSGRVCFATEAIVIHKLSVPDVMREGRWLSESAFRTYIDIIGASAAQSSFASKSLAPAADFCRAHVLRYFTVAKLESEQHGYASGKEALKLHRPKIDDEASGGKSALAAFAPSRAFKRASEGVDQGAHCHAQSRSGKGKSRPRHAASVQIATATSAAGQASTRAKGKGKGKGLRERLLGTPLL